jgi:hypothetical protein
MPPHLLPSQSTLITASTLYPLIFYASLPSHPSPTRIAQSREAISIAHCTLMTILSLSCLRQSNLSSLLSRNIGGEIPDRDLPIITTRSEFANAITALETAYLLQDSVVLFYAARVARRVGRAAASTKGLNFTHLAWHHAGLSAALGLLQVYIARSREKGVLIVVMMMLMNASSPFGTVRWFLVNFRHGATRGIMLTTVGYLVAFGLCRVYLVYYILEMFGKQKGRSALEAFAGLKWHCQLGTGAMGVVNTGWFFMGVERFVRRYVQGGFKSKEL